MREDFLVNPMENVPTDIFIFRHFLNDSFRVEYLRSKANVICFLFYNVAWSWMLITILVLQNWFQLQLLISSTFVKIIIYKMLKYTQAIREVSHRINISQLDLSLHYHSLFRIIWDVKKRTFSMHVTAIHSLNWSTM